MLACSGRYGWGPSVLYDGYTRDYSSDGLLWAMTSDRSAYPGNPYFQIKLTEAYSDLAGKHCLAMNTVAVRGAPPALLLLTAMSAP